MPDIFIPLDTLGMSDYYHKAWNTNVLYRYTMDFTDRHRAKMNSIKTLDELDALLDSENLMAEFVKYAEQNGVARDDEGLELSREIIEAQIRAYIGRNALTDESGFYYNIYAIDDAMQRAVEELRAKLNKDTK